MGQMPSYRLVLSLEEMVTCGRREVGRALGVPLSLLPMKEGYASQMRLCPAIRYAK